MSGCSKEDNTHSKDMGVNPDGPSPSAEHAKRAAQIELRKTQFHQFAETHEAAIIETKVWAQAFTADLQSQFIGKTIAIQGNVEDIFEKNDSEWEMTLVTGGFMWVSGTRLLLSKEQGLRLLKALNRKKRIFVVAKLTRIIPVHLSARVCREPDCEEVEISERDFGKSYQLEANYLDFAVAP